MEKIRELAEKYTPYIIERRRYYHAHPELSFQEAETTAAIRADLEAMGLQPKLFEGCYGLTCMIEGAHPGRTIALRADIDALNIPEETGLPFASRNGYMHACGHDAHIAMQLGAAKILTEIRDELHGNVKLIFQPAEEYANGSTEAIKAGALDGVDAIYGTHVWGTLDAPLIDVTPGPRMAASHGFRITLKGKSAHGSTPQDGIDTIAAAAALIQNLQMIPTRFNDSRNPLVITVGTIRGGTAYNAIADRVVMDGSIRHFRKDKSIEAEMERIIRGTAEAMKVEYEFLYMYSAAEVLYNDCDELNDIAHHALVSLYGEESVGHLDTLMSSEDFATYLKHVPGIFSYIGTRNPAKGLTSSNHASTYSVDEDVLPRGAALAAEIAREYLSLSV